MNRFQEYTLYRSQAELNEGWFKDHELIVANALNQQYKLAKSTAELEHIINIAKGKAILSGSDFDVAFVTIIKSAVASAKGKRVGVSYDEFEEFLKEAKTKNPKYQNWTVYDFVKDIARVVVNLGGGYKLSVDNAFITQYDKHHKHKGDIEDKHRTQGISALANYINQTIGPNQVALLKHHLINGRTITFLETNMKKAAGTNPIPKDEVEFLDILKQLEAAL